MKLRYVAVPLFALIVVAGLVIAFRQPPFATLDLGSGYTMRFYARRAGGFMDDMPTSFYRLDYNLSRDSHSVWRRRFGGTFTPPSTLQFQVLTSPDRSVVAIVESFAPDIVLYMRDLASGEGWPEQADHEDHNPVRERGHRLLARLQSGVPHPLILSPEVKGRRTRL